jgi:uncharacterized membrane protein
MLTFGVQHGSGSDFSAGNLSAVAPAGLTPGDRMILGGVASIGLVETGYINAVKFGLIGRGDGLLCAGSGVTCGKVLNGPWAQVLGFPLTLPGMISYGAVIALAVAPQIAVFFPWQSEDGRGIQSCCDDRPKKCCGTFDPLQDLTQKGLLALTTSMAVFSGYLMVLLAFKIHANCPWCLLSAALSVSLGGFTWAKMLVSRPGLGRNARGQVPANSQHVYIVGISAFATMLAATMVYFLCAAEVAIAETQMSLGGDTIDHALYAAPPVTRQSSAREIAVAKALQAKGVKMYGAYWCSHCLSQKQLLGKEAMRFVDYVECAEDGKVSQAGLCRARKIPGYPTWEIDGELHAGEMSIEELEDFLGLNDQARAR